MREGGCKFEVCEQMCCVYVHVNVCYYIQVTQIEQSWTVNINESDSGDWLFFFLIEPFVSTINNNNNN